MPLRRGKRMEVSWGIARRFDGARGYSAAPHFRHIPVTAMNQDWSPDGWRRRPARQLPTYPDADELAAAERQLAAWPALVVPAETDALRERLAAVSRGEAFLMQGGDCAESFDELSTANVTDTFRVILQMAVVLTYGAACPVVKVGRIAGQFAKPRSSDSETIDGVTLPSYRGDIVNGAEFTAQARTPDPQRLLRAYSHSATVLNLLRALAQGGFADLHQVHRWTADFVRQSPQGERFEALAGRIADCLAFMEACGFDAARTPQLHAVEFYTSHEALHLHYEQAQTRFIERRGRWYNLSTHMPWIGLRTADLDGAHVEYCRGISNPVGVKVGPAMDAAWVQGLCRVLNPQAEYGRLVLIHRMGAKHVDSGLPPLVEAVRATGIPVLWVCDPMHGNTETTSGGIKTRRFENIVSELESSVRIHREIGSYLGGVHFELTGEDVTECTGGARGLGDGDLARAYRTTVDPRLNYEQALELAMRIATNARSA
jgi:3-deoxy-7-phosphoheptulonate synthase